MKSAELAKATDWNKFWGLTQKHPATNVSWSKKRIINIVRPYLKEGMNVLDAGCGSGFFTQFFCDQGCRTVAVDYADEALKITRERTKGQTEIVKDDLTDAVLYQRINRQFDLIFSDGLLEHFSLEVQNIILRNLTKLLNENGLIFTFVPNQWSPWELIRPLYMPGIKEKPFVYRDLVQLHQSNGLKIISSGGINVMPLPISPDLSLGKYVGMLLYTICKHS